MSAFTYTQKIPVKSRYDVIVAGGGVAGVAAAVSAAARGASVLLLEKSNILGGLATLGLVNYFVPMCNGRGRQIIFGLAEKWLRKSAELGYDTIPAPWREGEPKEPTDVRYVNRYSPYIFALQLMEEVTEMGVDLLYDCIAAHPIVEDGVCTGVITHSKSGAALYPCRQLIDTTGDADLLRAADIPTVERGNFFTYYGQSITLDSCRTAVETGDIRRAYANYFGGNINLFGDRQPSDVPMWHGTTVEEVSDYLIRNQRVMLDKLKGEPRSSRDLAYFPGMPQFRTTCRLDGNYTFSLADVYRHHEDSICAINDFEHRDHLFEVPYGCLCRRGYDNILTAGRSASGDGYGWDLLRVIPPAILTGQAAGEAAVLAMEEGRAVSDITVKTLQARLERGGVMLHFPDEYLPEDKTVIIHGKTAEASEHF